MDVQDGKDDVHTVLEHYKHLARHFDSKIPPAENKDIAQSLGMLVGSYAFVLFDRKAGRIVAVRDLLGKEPLYWGTHMFGEGLLFASERQLLESDCADADQFPAGTFFVSCAGQTSGSLGNILWLPIPPVETEELLEEERICRIDSAANLSDLPRVPSHADVTAH